VSYFRPPKIRKTGPRSICSLPDSTQNLSRKRGWVNAGKCAQRNCLTMGVHSSSLESFQKDGDVELRHPTNGSRVGHHKWILNDRQAKARLRELITHGHAFA